MKDVIVVGGGPSGMTAALALAGAGLSVGLLAPRAGADPRTTALLMPAVRLLERLGVWPAAVAAAAPLATMRIVDDTGGVPRAPEVTFEAAELGLPAFGYNIANDDLNAALAAAIAAEPAIVPVEDSAADLAVDDGTVEIVTAGGEAVAARLVVGADGGQSVVRTLAGIAARTWSYRQSALVTTLTHTRPHRNVSTEFHAAGGPFTLVPLPGDRSSLVWVDRPQELGRLAALDDGRLGAAVAARARFILGDMRVDGPRGTLPLGGLVAARMATGRVALVGEAGHRFPPIGAQGLNLGMRDVAVLAEVLADARRAGEDPGAAAVLERYDRRRRLDVSVRTMGVDLLNRSLLTSALPVTLGRGLGLYAAARLGPVRRLMMRAGLGAMEDGLPFALPFSPAPRSAGRAA